MYCYISLFNSSYSRVGQNNASAQTHTICCAKIRTRLNVKLQARFASSSRSFHNPCCFSTARLISSGSSASPASVNPALYPVRDNKECSLNSPTGLIFVLRPHEQCLPLRQYATTSLVATNPCIPACTRALCKAASTVCVIATDSKHSACSNPRIHGATDVVVLEMAGIVLELFVPFS